MTDTLFDVNAYLICPSFLVILVDEHARALEEQWIDSIDNANTASLSNSSAQTSRSFVSGVLLGFFFPILPVFFFFDSRPAVFWSDGTEHDTHSPSLFS